MTRAEALVLARAAKPDRRPWVMIGAPLKRGDNQRLADACGMHTNMLRHYIGKRGKSCADDETADRIIEAARNMGYCFIKKRRSII